ncbi:EAL domain-containing protein [Pseudoxanthomonas daejeonensis]|uniref:bifunctional diguanylate cyclase/phosphodiesterase n=1 Tax=Pseudoxanthomonas daejeonensis TaxID=266062 RepID=UPI001F53E7FA|nr:EAL domain-containing protein [Pseudoxanthomonas daejeonensis]UNK56226.1 EAL domain-containing protein [Pseudoxanthomonas daejeonensis]
MPFHDHMPAAPEVSHGGGLRASVAWAMLVLGVGLLFTAEMARREWLDARGRAQVMQQSLADAAQARVLVPLDTGAQALRAMQTVFLSNDRMDQQTFAEYQSNLRAQERVPGFVASAFARLGTQSAARAEYRYELVSPLHGNGMLVGLDIASQPQNLAALHRARDADMPSISAPFRLLQFPDADAAAARGMTVRLPVYSQGPRPVTPEQRRLREIGALAISLRLEPMLRQALQGRILEHMHVAITDLDAPPDQATVFASGVLPEGAAPQRRQVEFGGRRWELQLWPRSTVVETGGIWRVVAAGTIISVLLALLMLSQATTYRRALELGRRMSARFGESEARFRVLNELLPALVLLADGRDGRIVYANQAARNHLGAVLDTPLVSLFANPLLGGQAMAEATAGGSWASQEAMVVTAGGEAFWASASLAQVEVDGAPYLLMVATDTSEQRELTERLRYQAAHDGLTELCNRREFERRLQEALARRQGDADMAPFALLYIDLDQFKLINDVSGHMAGDQLLVQLVHALRAHLRPGDLLARLGGDEFGLLAFDIDEDQAQELAERMRQCIEGVMFVWQDRTYTVSASIGMVMVDRDGCTLKDLLAWADSACYQAKEGGRNRVCSYREDEDTTRRRSEMEWANRLRWALEQDRLLLDYQEVVPLLPSPENPIHIELLLRLREEDGTVFLPGAFIPAAERYGLMPLVDRWVIRTALANFTRLHACGGELRTCAINLSGASIEDDGLADFILDTIYEFGVPATRVCLEITETVAVRNLLRVVRVIERLRAVGCRIALDDFGAGMSSFGYLKNLPVDVIKIDGSFVRDLGSDPMSRAIVNAIAQIGQQRGLKVVAEWVDSERTLATLRELGVDYGQGFVLHRPERVLFQRPGGIRMPAAGLG